MVVAAGLSPAWQQVLVVDAFQAGAVNRAREVYWCGSGKVLNVGVALHHLSGGRAGQTLTLSTLGGLAYDSIEAEFGAIGVSRRWVRTQSPTRVCTTIVDRATGSATEMVENAAPVTDAELAEFEDVFAQVAADAKVVVLTGSLPKGAPPDFFRRLLRQVRGKAVLDFRGPERPRIILKPHFAIVLMSVGARLTIGAAAVRTVGFADRRGFGRRRARPPVIQREVY